VYIFDILICTYRYLYKKDLQRDTKKKQLPTFVLTKLKPDLGEKTDAAAK